MISDLDDIWSWWYLINEDFWTLFNCLQFHYVSWLPSPTPSYPNTLITAIFFSWQLWSMWSRVQGRFSNTTGRALASYLLGIPFHIIRCGYPWLFCSETDLQMMDCPILVDGSISIIPFYPPTNEIDKWVLFQHGLIIIPIKTIPMVDNSVLSTIIPLLQSITLGWAGWQQERYPLREKTCCCCTAEILLPSWRIIPWIVTHYILNHIM